MTMKLLPVSKLVSNVEGAYIGRAVTVQVAKSGEPIPLVNKSESSLNRSATKPKAAVKETPSPNLTIRTILDDGYIDKEKLKDLLNKTFGARQWKAKVSHAADQSNW